MALERTAVPNKAAGHPTKRDTVNDKPDTDKHAHATQPTTEDKAAADAHVHFVVLLEARVAEAVVALAALVCRQLPALHAVHDEQRLWVGQVEVVLTQLQWVVADDNRGQT